MLLVARNEYMLKSVIRCIGCHFGNTNPNYTYMIGNYMIPKVKSYSHIGVIRSSSNDSLEYTSHAVKRARRQAGLILRLFTSRFTAFPMQIFQLYVKPILMYTSPLRSPWQGYIRADKEFIQKRFTNICKG